MPRSTFILASLALMLAVSTGLIMWHVINASPGDPTVDSLVASTAVPLGLAQATPTLAPNMQIDATSALVWDSNEQKIIFQQNAFTRVPIASISKLMTAMVAIDHGINWQAPATINPDEYGPGGNLMLQPGETVTMGDLFNASLVGSANNATKAYVRQLGLSTDEFAQAMNRKAVEIGLEQTSFEEPTGLNPHNISTAYEVARLAAYAFSQYPEITKATQQSEYTFTIAGSGRSHTIRNTNKLISVDQIPLTGSKTGYLDEAQYCLVVRGAGERKNIIAVVLGSPSEAAHFAAIQTLLNM
jgi:serine-type D-Ala-D-Ala endopeptidase (penicillin-binding protein 7)